MVDRVGSDHPSVTTLRGTLVRRGGTRRPAVALPHEPGEGTEGTGQLPPDRPVRLWIDGRKRHAPVGSHDGTPAFLGAYDNPRLAREREGPDRLAEWVDGRDIAFGRSVLVDVVQPGAAYGLRVPGETAVYDSRPGPDEALRRIAEDLESG